MTEYDFSRQLKVSGMNEAAQAKLQAARILLIGAGGLGATALPYLVAAGIGQITIVDCDRIETSNLHRQIPFTYQDIGKYKADVAADFCQARSPYGTFHAVKQRLNADELHTAMNAHDLTLDCSDDRQLAYQLSDAALLCGKHVIFANAAALAGQLFTMLPSEDTPCWRCLWPEEIQPGGNCNALGVLGPVPATLGCWQALTAIKLLAGIPVAYDEMLYYDFATMRQHVLRIDRQTHCAHQIDAHTYRSRHMQDYIYPYCIDQGKADGMVIIDIRRPEEWAERALPQADMRVEMTELHNNPEQHLEANKAYLLVCAAGIRSKKTAAALRKQGYDNVFAYPSAW